MTARCLKGASLVLLLLLGACQQIARPTLPTPAPPTPKPAPAAQRPAPPPAKAIVPVQSEPAPDIATVEPAQASNNGQAVFARLQRRLSMPACASGASADRWREHYARNPEAFARHLQAILPLLDFVSIETEREDLPAEFALIPLVESWYRPDAMGRGGPAGMWQMIASTARYHDIHIQAGYDGRLSPVESTRAALAYLKTLHADFDDWRAALLAYNIGPYRLRAALRKAGASEVSAEKRKPQGLPNAAYDYIAKLQALSCLIAEPQRRGLQLPETASFTELAAVPVDERIQSLDQLAAESGHDADLLKHLNPGYKAGRISAGAPRLVLMPSTPEQPLAATATTDPPAESATADDKTAPAVVDTHRVRAGDTLWSIAKRYGVSIKQLQRINGLRGKSSLRVGQLLKLLP